VASYLPTTCWAMVSRGHFGRIGVERDVLYVVPKGRREPGRCIVVSKVAVEVVVLRTAMMSSPVNQPRVLIVRRGEQLQARADGQAKSPKWLCLGWQVRTYVPR
jgi:hypothetical protein